MKKFDTIIAKLIALTLTIVVSVSAIPVYATEIQNDNSIEQNQTEQIEEVVAPEITELNYEYKLGLERLLEDFPKTLEVVFSDEEHTRENIPVEWKCSQDYDEELQEYIFIPDLSDFSPVADIVLPSITVTVENDNTIEYVGGYIDDGEEAVPIVGSADEPMLRSFALDEQNEDSYYNAYDAGLLPAIRNQGSEGACWSFADLGAMETDMILRGADAETIDFSELQLSYFAYHNYTDIKNCHNDDRVIYTGKNYLSSGGNSTMSIRSLANSVGPVSEALVPYSRGNSYIVPDEYAQSRNLVQLMAAIKINPADRAGIKEAIKEHGSVSAAINADSSSYSAIYNSYYSISNQRNHAVMLVGWNDNFPKENFKRPGVENDGAWLVRNSWGLDDYGYNGYFWMSYEDVSFINSSSVVAYDTREKIFDNCYSYDGSVLGTSYVSHLGEFEVIQSYDVDAGEEIAAVSIELGSANVEGTVYLYIDEDENPYSETSFSTSNAGLYVIDLDEPVAIDTDSQVEVDISLESRDGTSVKVAVEPLSYTASSSYSFESVQSSPHNGLFYDDKMYGLKNDLRMKLFSNNIEQKDEPGQLVLSPERIYDYVGSEYTMSLGDDSVDLTNFEWESTDTDIAMVDEAGVVTLGAKKGSCIIRCTDPETGRVYEAVAMTKPYKITYMLGEGEDKSNLPSYYYPGDSANCILSSKVYKKGYSFAGWYLDEELTQPLASSTALMEQRGDLELYPKWSSINFAVYYYPIDSEGAYKTTVARIAENGITIDDMPYTIPEGKNCYIDPDRYAAVHNASYPGKMLYFSYFSYDREGKEPATVIGDEAFKYTLSGGQFDPNRSYTQQKQIILYPQYSSSQTMAALESAYLTESGDICLNIEMSFTDELADDSGAYVLLNGKKCLIRDAEKVEADLTSSGELSGTGLRCVFRYEEAVKEIFDTVHISVYSGDGRLQSICNSKGKSYADNVAEYSIADYCDDAMKDNSGLISSDLKEYCRKLKTYAAYAKAYFDYALTVSGNDIYEGAGAGNDIYEGTETGNYIYESAGAGVEPGSDISSMYPIDEIDEEELEAYATYFEGKLPEGLRYVGSSLLLNSRNAVRHYFVLDDKTCQNSISDYSFAIKNNGKFIAGNSLMLDGKADAYLSPTEKAGVYYVEVSNILSMDFDKDFALIVSKKDEQSTEASSDYIIHYSVNSYINKAIKKDEALSSLVRAMYIWGRCD